MVKLSLLKLVMSVPRTINAETRLVHTFVTKVMVSGGLTDKKPTRTNVFTLWRA